jgi:acetyl esterase/lipase
LSPSFPTTVHRYGPHPSQFGHLSLPASEPPHRAVILLHGGFWHRPWGLDLMFDVAGDLLRRGLAVWNLEYRRVGEPGGGWPGTFDDVLAGFDALAGLPEAAALDLFSIGAAGHSAGGHLALWLAAERGPRAGGAAVVTAAVGLAAVPDLRYAWESGTGDGAVEALLGGPPHAVAERYRFASPAERLPIGVRQLLVHGERDRVVPPGLSRRYVAEARASGDQAAVQIVPKTGHMDVIKPAGSSWQFAAGWLQTVNTGPI